VTEPAHGGCVAPLETRDDDNPFVDGDEPRARGVAGADPPGDDPAAVDRGGAPVHVGRGRRSAPVDQERDVRGGAQVVGRVREGRDIPLIQGETERGARINRPIVHGGVGRGHQGQQLADRDVARHGPARVVEGDAVALRGRGIKQSARSAG